MYVRPGLFRVFRFDSSRLRGGLFAPRKPRHPLLRLAFGLVGLALLVLLVVVGAVVGAAMIMGGLLFKLLAQRGKSSQSASDGRVVDAEYRVIEKPALPASN